MHYASNSNSALFAGLAGTAAMTALISFGSMFGVAGVEIPAVIAAFLHVSVWVGWAIYFVIGSLLAVFYGLFPGSRDTDSGWLKGVLFGAGAWLLSALVFAPLLGGSLFAGPLAAVFVSLFAFIAYGAVTGVVYRPREHAGAVATWSLNGGALPRLCRVRHPPRLFRAAAHPDRTRPGAWPSICISPAAGSPTGGGSLPRNPSPSRLRDRVARGDRSP